MVYFWHDYWGGKRGMKTNNPHILIADGDQSFGFILSDYLTEKGYDVDIVFDGEDALERIREAHFDFVLMDIVLPRRDGFSIMEEMQALGMTTPVICLSARSAKDDMVKAYNLGCVDYIVKPVQMELLLCKMRVVLRLTGPCENEGETEFVLGDKHFDSVKQTINGKHISARESDLLLMLCRHEGQLVDRRRILMALWNKDDYFSSRSLSVYVNHLRHYLEGTDYRVLVVHGKGYKLVKY